MARPERLVVVLGTATDVGKTWAGAAMAAAARRRGLAVAARKPAQSFAPDQRGATDAHQLAEATGEAPTDVCPEHRWYEVPMAPPMAAAVLGRPPFTLDDLVAEVRWPDGVALGLVEGVGGVRSPLAASGSSSDDGVALAVSLGADAILLVADAGLGTIGAVRLGVEALHRHRVVVLLNRYDDGDDLHRRNAAWLREVDATTVATSVDVALDELLGG